MKSSSERFNCRIKSKFFYPNGFLLLLVFHSLFMLVNELSGRFLIRFVESINQLAR